MKHLYRPSQKRGKKNLYTKEYRYKYIYICPLHLIGLNRPRNPKNKYLLEKPPKSKSRIYTANIIKPKTKPDENLETN